MATKAIVGEKVGMTQVWGDDNRVIMTGPASESFRGSFDWGEYA